MAHLAKIIAGCFTATLFVASSALALDTIYARATLQLCPEYRFGGVNIALKYKVRGSQSEFAATILSQEVDIARSAATFSIALPANYASTPLDVYAVCVNSRGVGAPSAPKSITACDSLAFQDTDNDQLRDNFEDTNCNQVYDRGDLANFLIGDSDQDGAHDLVEALSGTRLNWLGSSPQLAVLKGAPADFDGDGVANAVVWRPASGMWYIRDFTTPGSHLAVQWGLPGDAPFVYNSPGYFTNVGVVREQSDGTLRWYFRPPGFLKGDLSRVSEIVFGQQGDILIPGPWEDRAITSPAVARMRSGAWEYYFYHRNGSVTSRTLGTVQDVPKIGDYDGDGLFDLAVYRASEDTLIIARSSNGTQQIVTFGLPNTNYLVRGDFSGDGRHDITYWEPLSAVFHTVFSENGYSTPASTLQLGLYGVHQPLSFNRANNRDLFTVVDHQLGLRYWRTANEAEGTINSLQWGLSGDAQG